MEGSTGSRFLKFNGVGAIGFALQLGLLALLLRAGLHYLAATAIAVELTILHNFWWHERWTWRDRTTGSQGAVKRLAKYWSPPASRRWSATSS